MNPIRPFPGATDGDAAYRLDLWRSLPPGVAEALRRAGSSRGFVDGQTVVQRGQPLDAMLVLARGRLRSITTMHDGHEHLIRWVESGEAVGVASVLAGVPFQADLVASGDCEVSWIPGAALTQAIRADAEVGLVVARHLALRLSEVFDHIAGLTETRLEARVRAALVHLAVENGQSLPDGRFALRVTQADVAAAVDGSRQRVNEALRRLGLAGLVELGYRRMVVDVAGLRRFVDPA